MGQAGRPTSHYLLYLLYLLYHALLCIVLFCLSFKIQCRGMKYKLWVYPARQEERPNKGTDTQEEHASQHRSTTHPPLGVLLQLASSAGTFFLTSASCRRHFPNVATTLRLWCAQPLFLAYFRMLVFTFGICGNVWTVYPSPSPGNNPRQPVPLVVNAVATMFWMESAMIAFLPRATATTTTTTSTATAWPADNHYSTKPWTLHADQPVHHDQRQAI